MNEKKIRIKNVVDVKYNPKDKYAFEVLKNKNISFSSYSINQIQTLFDKQRTILDARKFATELMALSAGGIEHVIDSTLYSKPREDRIVKELNNTRDFASKVFTALLDYR